MKIIFYVPVNTDKPKAVAFVVFVRTTASFTAQISSSENVSARARRHLGSGCKTVNSQGYKDIPSYGRQSKSAKIAIY